MRLTCEMNSNRMLTVAKAGKGAAAATLLKGVVRSTHRSIFMINGVKAPCASGTLRVGRGSMAITRVDDFRLRAVSRFTPGMSTVLGVARSRLGHRRAVRRCVHIGRLVARGRNARSMYILGCRSRILHRFKGRLAPQIMCFSDKHGLSRKVCLSKGGVVLGSKRGRVRMIGARSLGLLKGRGFRGIVTTITVTCCSKMSLSDVHGDVYRFATITREVRCIARGGNIMCCGSSGKAGPSTTVGKVRTVGHPALLVNNNCSGRSNCSR